MNTNNNPIEREPTGGTAKKYRERRWHAMRTNSYDFAVKRQSHRSQREKGCWVYIPLDELLKARIDPHDPAPLYRTYGTPEGTIIVRLYKNK